MSIASATKPTALGHALTLTPAVLLLAGLTALLTSPLIGLLAGMTAALATLTGRALIRASREIDRILAEELDQSTPST